MSTPGIILPRSWLDGVSINASSEASSALGIANVQNDQPSEPWRSNGAGVHTWEWDFGEPLPIDTIVLWKSNLDLADTVQMERSSDNGYSQDLITQEWPGRYPMHGWGEQPWDGGPVGGDDDTVYKAPFVVEHFDMKARQYGRITFDRQSGYAQIGRAMLGYAWKPGERDNYDWGMSLDWALPSEVEKSSGGQMFVDVREDYRIGTVNWSWLDQYGAKAWDDILYTIGKHNTILFVAQPDRLNTTYGRRDVILARIMGTTGPTADNGRWHASMQIEEVI